MMTVMVMITKGTLRVFCDPFLVEDLCHNPCPVLTMDCIPILLSCAITKDAMVLYCY